MIKANVLVKNIRGEFIMPCGQRKARVLLRDKKTKIVSYNPFTIQLKYATGESMQLDKTQNNCKRVDK